MAEKLIFENFQISSRLQKNLYIRQSKEFFEYFYIAIWSVNTYDNSYKFLFSLDNSVSSCRGKYFQKLLLRAVANRVKYLVNIMYLWQTLKGYMLRNYVVRKLCFEYAYGVDVNQSNFYSRGRGVYSFLFVPGGG